MGEYPTPIENSNLNRINTLRQEFPDIEIGLSTHEPPDEDSTAPLAVAMGCTIIEKHVGVPTDTINLNASLTSVDLSSATNTFPLFVGGSEILKSMSFIDNTVQNRVRIYNTANKFVFDGTTNGIGSDTLEIDFTATSTTGYCEFGFYANSITSGMIFYIGIAAATGGTSPFSTALGSGAVSIDAYKLGLLDGSTSYYSLRELLDFTGFENTYLTSKFYFNNLTVGTRYRMALYGRCYNSGSIFIHSGGRSTTGLATGGRSFFQPAFMKFYEYDSSIGGARTTGSGGGGGM